MEKFDLHVHSTFSDGIFSVEQLVDNAFRLRLSGFALTDHDIIAGVLPAIEYGRQRGVEVLAGVELSVPWQDGDQEREAHILGYLFDPSCVELQQELQTLAAARATRAQQMLVKLADLGMSLPANLLEKEGVVGRGNISRALIEAGYESSTDDVFSKWLNPGCPAYVPRAKLTARRAVELIHLAGGLAVLAHPGASKADGLLAELVARGLDGIEVQHPQHDLQQQIKYAAIAKSYGLLATAGSDCHDGGLGDFGISREILAKMFKICSSRIK